MMNKYRFKTIDITPLNKEIYRIRIVPQQNNLFEFNGGQYLILEMPTGEQVPLSIASAPEEINFIELHVRVVDGHPLAEDMLKLFQSNNRFSITGPFGSCYLNDSPRELVIIAGGTGFSPMKSMIESAFANNSKRKISLFLGAQIFSDLYLHQLINQWQSEQTNFTYIPVLSNHGSNWKGEIGFPHQAAMKCKEHELIEKDFYISGSEAMVIAVYESLRSKHVPKSQIHSDILNIKRENGEIS